MCETLGYFFQVVHFPEECEDYYAAVRKWEIEKSSLVILFLCSSFNSVQCGSLWEDCKEAFLKNTEAKPRIVYHKIDNGARSSDCIQQLMEEDPNKANKTKIIEHNGEPEEGAYSTYCHVEQVIKQVCYSVQHWT
ncbi:hypothetical protein GDO78_017474 [Eleutherodactylus coqui]|uniref:Nephrocystin-3 alpha-beta domain-containing protein n=1 Tax=Eleutherodactylus coqui TaxID=57060 RepID=A0A8J6B4I5_ELECQ|nr:hypothetical protein GDO78_017474 [Eleutherodactylus coqui]